MSRASAQWSAHPRALDLTDALTHVTCSGMPDNEAPNPHPTKKYQDAFQQTPEEKSLVQERVKKMPA